MKKPSRGQQIAAAKIWTAVVRPCFHLLRHWVVPTSVNIKTKFYVADFTSSHWYQHSCEVLTRYHADTGGNS
jgi:hypothetical protein